MSSSWFGPIDAYCERLDPGFWSEPMNALSNVAFLLAAACAYRLWRREGGRDWPAFWLIGVTTAVGIGSFLFHTFARRWAALADVIPIAIFIYSYLYIALRRFLGFKPGLSATMAGLFIAFNMSFARLWQSVIPTTTLNGSIGYIPALLALVATGSACLAAGREQAARALFLATAVFALSLLFRSIDLAVCGTLPIGTHMVWHLLNGLVLLVLMRAAIRHRSLAC